MKNQGIRIREFYNRGISQSNGSQKKISHLSQGTSPESVKAIFFLTLFSISALLSHAASRYAVNNGNWNTNATWSATSGGPSGASFPVAGDVVYIEGSRTVTVTAAAACTDLNIAALSSLSIGGFNFTVSGNTTISGTLTHSSTTGTKTFSGNLLINSGGSWINTINESITLGGNLQNDGTFTSGTGIYTMSGVSKTISGTGINSIPNLTITGTITNNGTLTVGTSLAGTGSLTNSSSSLLNITGNATITSLVASATGNMVKYNRSGSQTAKAASYYNLTVSGSGTKTFATTPTVTNILSVEGTGGIAVTTGAVTYGPNATLQYNTTASRTVSSAEWVSPFTASGGVILLSPYTFTLNSAKTFTNAPLTIKAGSRLSMGANSLTLSTGLVLECGSSTAGSRIASTLGTLNLGGNITVISMGTGINGATIAAPVSLGATRTLTIADDGTTATDLTISGAISGTGFGITKAGAGTLVLSGSGSYTGVTTINAGIVKIGAAGTSPNSPLGTAAAGTIVSAGAVLDLGGYSLAVAENLTLNGTGIAGNGSLINSSATSITFSGPIQLGSASTINTTGAITATGIISGSAGLTKTGTGTLTLSGANTFTGGTTLNAGTLNINNAQALGAATGTFTINGGTINNTTAATITTVNYPIALNANFVYTGTRALTFGTGEVTLTADRMVTASGNTLIFGGPFNAGTYSFTKAGAGTLTLSNPSVTFKNLTISAGTLVSTTGTLTLKGNLTNNSRFNSNNGTVVFSGITAQTISGTGATTFTNLTVNNSAGVSLTGAVNTTVNGILNLSSGVVVTNANILVLPSTGSVVRTSGFVSGNLQKNVATGLNINKTFEVGTGTSYAPVTLLIARVTTAGNLIVKSTAGDHASIGTSAINSARNVNRYWTLTNSGIVTTSAGYSATFTFVNPGDPDAGSNTANFVSGRYATGAWTSPVTGARTSTSFQATVALASAFGDFVIGEPKPATTTTTLVSSLNPSCQGALVTFTASVVSGGSPVISEGTVTFKDGTTTLGTSGTLDAAGNAALSTSALTLGTHSITAVFNATSNFSGSTSPALSQVVNAQQWIGGASGDWENAANWCGSVPGVTTNVTIPGGTTIHITSAYTTPARCNNLTINSGGALVIDAAKALTVGGSLVNNAIEGLVIKSSASGTGSLLENGISGSGTVKAERYITKYNSRNDGMYHFLATPVSGQNILTSFSNPPGNSSDDFYKLDEPTYTWISYRNAAGDGINPAFESTLTPGRGYLVAYSANVTKTFTGQINSGNLTTGTQLPGLTFTSSLGSIAGWNLLGNPYCSAISWDDVIAGGQASNLDNAVYVYDNATQQYKTWVNGLGTLTDGIIPAMQGFLVKANAASPSLTLKNINRVHGGTAYYKSAQTSANNVLSLKVSGNSRSDETCIRFRDEATTDFNEEWDAYKLMGSSSVPNLYSVTNNMNYAVNSLPVNEMKGAVAIAFTAGSKGTFTLSVTGTDNFSAETNVTLLDKKTGITQLLNSNPAYTFTAAPGEDANRFELHFLDVTAVQQPERAESLRVYQNNGTLNVITDKPVNADIILTNMLGQVVMRINGNGNDHSAIDVSGLQNGIYVLSLKGEKAKISRKIVVRN